MNMDDTEVLIFANWMNCSKGLLPFTYLGLSFSDKKIIQKVLMPFIEKISWKGRFLSWGARLKLINYVLIALPSYFMSMFKLPRWAINRIEKMRRAFFWKEKENVSGFNCLES